MSLERMTLFCFAACYGLALGLELLQLSRPRNVLRALAVGFGLTGLAAHTLFLIGREVSPASQAGALLFPAWILAVFYVIGAVHHRRVTWGVFVLPVVLMLCGIAGLFHLPMSGAASSRVPISWQGAGLWTILHISFFICAAVGVSVGFVASVMYLFQARRLKAKMLHGKGVRLLSLERLERMNRRAIALAFPLLTLGLLLGMALMARESGTLEGWTDPRIISTVFLWLVFAIVVYLRYGLHLQGRRVALLTIMAFALLLVTLVTAHQHPLGGAP
jgi:ABC-type transport system involved in cytochrome c biogenesis permease subunit